MTRASLLLAALLATAAAAKPRRPAPVAAPASPSVRGPVAPVRVSGAGQITFVTATSAFVDRGQLDGVDVGEVLTFKRRGGPAGTCKVVQRSAHNATCTPQGSLRVGDRFAVDEKAAAPGPAPLPALPSPTELRLRLDAVERAAIPLHDFGGESELSVGAASQVRLSLRHDSWMRQGGGPFHRESLGVRINGLELYKGIRLWADAQVALWGNRPAGYRYPVGVVQPVIRRLEVSWREPGEKWSVALGRTWPVAAPGLVVLDGAQASYRAADGSLEAGAYGGALPDDITLVPSRRWTGGAFAALRVAGEEGSRRVLIGSARAAWLAVPGSGSRLEGQVALRAWSGQLFGGGGEVLLGAPLGGGTLAPGAVDGARLSVQVHPLDRLSLQADGRYQSGVAGGFSDAALVVAGRSFRGSGDVTFDLLPTVSMSVRAGAARQLGAAVSQVYVGPVVTWSPGDLGLQVGYLEELGWLRGRSASLGVWVSFARRVRLQARGAWFEQQNTVAASGFAGRDFGASVLLDADLTSWLSLRVSALGRTSPQATGLTSALDAALELSARF